MPNKPSAKKELRKSKKRSTKNEQILKELKKLNKDTRAAIASGKSEAQDLILKTLKALDKAAQKAVIKKNTRDRKKSRLAQAYNKAVKK